MQSFIAVAYKIPNISSFKFVNIIKSALKQNGIEVSKIGFLGTLDYFARGQLIVGINQGTKLLPHIEKSSKTYRATLFLGMESPSLDSENVRCVKKIKAFKEADIRAALPSGQIQYSAPAFSAKHINGTRAYKLARDNKMPDMPLVRTDIHHITLLSYNHPFINFEVSVSKGGYIRSIGQIITKNLNTTGALCYLERLSEGDICYKDLVSKKNQNLDSKDSSHSFRMTAPSQNANNNKATCNDAKSQNDNSSVMLSESETSLYYKKNLERQNQDSKDSSHSFRMTEDVMLSDSETSFDFKPQEIQNLDSKDSSPLTQNDTKNQNDNTNKQHTTKTHIINLNANIHGIHTEIPLVIMDFKRILNYDTISLHFHSKEAFNGADITLDLSLCYDILSFTCRDYGNDSSNFLRARISYITDTSSRDRHVFLQKVALPQVFLGDFGSHFAVIRIHRSGRIEYIVNRISKC